MFRRKQSKQSRSQSQIRRSILRSPRLESLEQRQLFSIAPSDIAHAMNMGMNDIEHRAEELARQAFGTDLPILVGSLGDALSLGGKIAEAVGHDMNEAVDRTLADFRHELEELGFEVLQLETTPDGQGDLLRVHRKFVWTGEQAFLDVGGKAGFKYLQDGVDGELDGQLSGTAQPIEFDLTFGVDTVTGKPRFYLSDSTSLIVNGVHLEGTGHGNLGIKSLLNVDVSGTVKADLAGGLRFVDVDHKVRVEEISSDLRGEVHGGVKFENVSFDAKMPLIQNVHWTGAWAANLHDGTIDFATPTLNLPSADSVLVGIGKGLLDAKNGFPLLGRIGDLLSSPIPVLNQSIGANLGINSTLGWLVNSVSPDVSRIRDQLQSLGIKVGIPTDPQGAASMIDKLIHGERVDLLKYETSGGSQWGFDNNMDLVKIPLGIGTLDVSARLGAHFGWDYFVGLGVDSMGFYIDPNTHIGISGGVETGLTGSFKLGGLLSIASVFGGVGLRAGARVDLFDPDPSDGRVYLDEIFREGEDLTASFLAAMDISAYGDAYGHVGAKIDFIWPITLFDEKFQLASFWDVSGGHTLQSSKRIRLSEVDKPLVLTKLSDGTLVINGDNDRGDRVILSGGNGVVTVNWLGHGKSTFQGVTKVKFLGNGGNDRLEVLDGFNVRVEAFGGDGDDVLQGGAAADLLDGGAGNDRLEGRDGADTLFGRAGADLIRGGGGADLLQGNEDADTLDGGDDNDTVFGGAGDDYLLGGAGADSLKGEAGNDALRGGDGADNLDGGLGNDQLFGDGGDDLLNGGVETDASQANDFLFGGAGADTLRGGIGNDVLQGGLGNDSLLGEADNDFLSGDDGADSLDGGTGDDFLSGGASDDTLLGGIGDDVLRGEAGADLLRGGDGADRLNGGADLDTLYGDAGDDTIELDFASNTTAAVDKVFGGIGRDTVAVVGTTHASVDPQTNQLRVDDTVDDEIRLVQVSATDFRAESYDPVTHRLASSFVFSLLAGTASDIETVGVYGLGGNDILSAKVLSGTTPRRITLDGGDGNDLLTGSEGDDLLIGSRGTDTLFGGRGNDELRGGDDRDYLYGEAGNDMLYGEAGDDELDGGVGSDVSYGGDGEDHIVAGTGPFGDVMYGDAPGSTGDWNDLIEGGAGNDLIMGGGGADQLNGGSGDDVILGEGGDDTIIGGAGIDALMGGDDNDTVYAETTDTRGESQSVDSDTLAYARLADYAFQVENRWYGVNEEMEALDLLDGASNGAMAGVTSDGLTIARNRLADALSQLTTLKTDSTPDDQQRSQIAALDARVKALDALDGRLDKKLGTVAAATIPSLRSRFVELLDQVVAAANELATVHSEQTALLGHQTLRKELVVGGAGADKLFGSRHADWILGDQGDDFIYSSAGVDIESGGDGHDTYVFMGTDSDDRVEIYAATDSITHETLPGVKVNGVLAGYVKSRDIEATGIETLGGNDTVTVSFGQLAVSDIYVDAGAGDDVVNLTGLQANAIIVGGAGNDTLTGGLGKDAIFGGQGADEISGGDSDDRLFVDAQDTKIDGGNGLDEVVVQGDGAVRIDLGLSHVEAVDATSTNAKHTFDASRSTEKVTIRGGAGDETIIGSPYADNLQGGGGADSIDGGYGDDTILGGDGNDTLAGSAGADTIYGGAGDDDLNGDGWWGIWRDELHGEGGNDRLHFTGGADIYDGGEGLDDRIVLPLYAGQTLVAFANGFYENGNGTWVRYTAESNFEGQELETAGSNSTIRRGTSADDVQGYGVFRGALFVDGGLVDLHFNSADDYGDQGSGRGTLTYMRSLNTVRDGQYVAFENFDGTTHGVTSGGIRGLARTTMHPPANGQMSVIRWQAPVSGRIRIQGWFEDQDPRVEVPNGGIGWFVDHNSGPSRISSDDDSGRPGQLATGSIPNGGGRQSYDVYVSVSAGDFIYFGVDPQANFNNDTTGYDWRIDYQV